MSLMALQEKWIIWTKKHLSVIITCWKSGIGMMEDRILHD